MPENWTRGRKAWVAAGIGAGLVGRELYRGLRKANLRGQVALITGGSRGLGFLLARELALQGCRVAICARDDQELARARTELERSGATVLAARCDVTQRGEVEAFVDEVNTCFGRVDLLVNNAGLIAVGPVATMTLRDYEQAMGVMFWGMLFPTLAVLPQMRERRCGRIVNITSVGGKVSVPHLLPYSSAKFAAVGFSEGLGAELARDGIRVTTVVPGLMRTGSYVNALFKGRRTEEFTWFGLGSALPLVSISAERAAREIVKAVRRGDREVILSLSARLMVRLHGLFPSTMIDLFALVNRLLPGAEEGETATERGQEVQERLHSPLLDTLTFMGRSAAQRYQHAIRPAESVRK